MSDHPSTGRAPLPPVAPLGSDLEGDRADTVANALAVLRRRWAVLAVCVLACVLVALVLHERRMRRPLARMTAHQIADRHEFAHRG